MRIQEMKDPTPQRRNPELDEFGRESCSMKGRSILCPGRINRWWQPAWLWLLLGLLSLKGSAQSRELRDLFTDTWVATDALGRNLPKATETGPPRRDRTVGIFYFLWHGAHIQGGPFDVTQILKKDPEAMNRPDSPLWGPLHVPHHWGESIFGYYLTDDEGVLRKHAQMLSDAGVDVVIFDVTNQLTYPEWYRVLLKVWGEMRASGNSTPQVAFLTPFGDPNQVVHKLWRELYAPGLHPELWFHWEGKPLLLADPRMIPRSEEHAEQNTAPELLAGHTLGQRFKVDHDFDAVGGRFPTYHNTNSGITLKLFRVGDTNAALAVHRFEQVRDNSWLMLKLAAPQPPGNYELEASDPSGRIGWWSHTEDKQPQGQAEIDAQLATGDRTLRLAISDEETRRIQEFFTFRKPQPDYFQGPTQPDMWSWLEVRPQHVFRNSRGEAEQMSVGVAQNAVGNRLGSMSEAGARGRSYHHGATDPRPDAVLWGYNVSEQWERALQEDPRFIFVTGWNEWIAGRFAEFNGIKRPVMFVDQFDQEHSRDIEPMLGGHGDDYYYQFVGYVRRYKGARAPIAVQPQRIRIDGHFEDWAGVQPEFRDTIADPVRRLHRGWDPKVTYRNETGRNDLVAAKLSFDSRRIYFHMRAAAAITPPAGTNWMLLFVDADANPRTGWLGYDFVVNRTSPGSVERYAGPGFAWERAGVAEWKLAGAELELSVRWPVLGLKGPPGVVDFKWADNCIERGDWTDFTLNGDAAPNDRFNYRAVLRP